MLDKNVRLAACHAVDKKAIVKRLLRGYGVPIDTLEAPEYAAFDPSIKVALRSGAGRRSCLPPAATRTEKPVKFTIQTTRGFKPKDYEMIQAIVGMWRKVGIEANIEVYEIAKHFELRTVAQARAGGVLQLGQRDRRSDHFDRLRDVRPSRRTRRGTTDDLDAKIGPLWGEKDEAKRIARLEGRRHATSPSRAM